MGSPYNTCELETPFSLPEREWQDLYSVNENNSICAFVYWDIIENNPGFRVLIYNKETNKFTESEHLEGCCKSLNWSKKGFIWEAYPEGTGIISEKT